MEACLVNPMEVRQNLHRELLRLAGTTFKIELCACFKSSSPRFLLLKLMHAPDIHFDGVTNPVTMPFRIHTDQRHSEEDVLLPGNLPERPYKWPSRSLVGAFVFLCGVVSLKRI